MNLHELKILRNELKVELLELAALTGMPESYLNQIEERVIQPSPQDLQRIERALLKIKSDPDRMNDLKHKDDDDVVHDE